jgi:hypothetical protein
MTFRQDQKLLHKEGRLCHQSTDSHQHYSEDNCNSSNFSTLIAEICTCTDFAPNPIESETAPIRMAKNPTPMSGKYIVRFQPNCIIDVRDENLFFAHVRDSFAMHLSLAHGRLSSFFSIRSIVSRILCESLLFGVMITN